MGFIRTSRMWIIPAVLLVISACAPVSLKPEDSAAIRKIALVTSLRDVNPCALDHTHIGERTYGGFMFGAVGGFVEGVVIVLEQTAATRASLGGSIDDLKKELGTLPAKELIDRKLVERLSKAYRVIGPQELPQELSDARWNATDESRQALITACKERGADTAVRVDFAYGLAAYSGEKASTAIDAVVEVYNVNKGELILKKVISSDEYFQTAHTVSEVARNKAALFKEEFEEAADGLSMLIASEMGIGREQVEKRRNETLRAAQVTCNKPYKLDQDCNSIVGARRSVEVNGFHMKIAGSGDGKVVLLMGSCHSHKDVKLDLSRNPTEDDPSYVPAEMSSCFDAAKNEFAASNINILKISKLVNNGYINGYILHLDGDGYSILKQHTLDEF